MPETNIPESLDPPSDQASGFTQAHKNAWNETLEDMWALEEELQGKGWDTIETAAGHTGLAPATEDMEVPKMVHVVPDSDGEAMQAAFEEGDFPTYDVYRKQIEDWVFCVLLLLDPDTNQAILIATEFEVRNEGRFIEQTKETGELHSVVKFLNGDRVGMLRHENPKKFFPENDPSASDSA